MKEKSTLGNSSKYSSISSDSAPGWNQNFLNPSSYASLTAVIPICGGTTKTIKSISSLGRSFTEGYVFIPPEFDS
jgi:hypothetical protein